MTDKRNIITGTQIPSEYYADQPYIIATDDAAWLCVLTTGSGVEGEPGQHVVTLRSTNQGQTWEEPVDVEPADGTEASYAVLLKIPNGRIYCFYNHNTDNLREVIADDPPFAEGKCKRVDSLGYFVFKYSDDHGRTWSNRRYPIPLRVMDIDRANPYAGAVKFFWNVGKPFISAGTPYVPQHKVGGFGEGFFTRSEGVLLCSNNLLTEQNPDRIEWQTLPDGDIGLRTPAGGGPIAEEQSFAVLSDGAFYCVYRSVDGHPVCTYSRDGGHTWSAPQYQRYSDGRLMKHPRAANFIWRCLNGNYLYWYHNHGGRFIGDKSYGVNPYDDRNPVWLCGGVECDSPAGKVISWSQPEIVLYDDDPFIRISYPDLIEYHGHYFLSETQKSIARIHEIDTTLLEGLWKQTTSYGAITDGCLLDTSAANSVGSSSIAMSALPSFVTRDNNRADYGSKHTAHGMAIEIWLRLSNPSLRQVILDNRNTSGKGFVIQTNGDGAIGIALNDGRTTCGWDSDAGCLRQNTLHHVVINIDSGANIITFIIDGRLCDGGDERQFGWGRLNPLLRDVNGAPDLRINAFFGQIERLRIYGRYLRTSEAIASFRRGAG